MLRRECETDVLNKYVEINIFNTLEKEVSMRLLKKYFITTIILLFLISTSTYTFAASSSDIFSGGFLFIVRVAQICNGKLSST